MEASNGCKCELEALGCRKSFIHPATDLIPCHRWPLLRDPQNPRKNKILKADLFIAEIDGGRVGYIALCESTHDSYDKTVELWMVIVDPERRGEGFGRKLLDLALDRLTAEAPDRKIASRCFPASQPMFLMLQRRGFKMVKRTEDGVRHLELLPEK